MNQGRQANQFGILAKVEFPKFQEDDVRALPWHRQYLSVNGENVSWEVYKNAIIQRFGSIFEDPMSALKNAKYEKNAKEYQDLFDTLLCRVTISQEHAINAYSLTRLQEAILDVVKKKNKPSGSFNSNRFGNGGNYGNVSKPAILPKPNTPVNTTKYTPGHKCAGQLFSLVLVPDDEDCFEDCIDDEEENRNSMGIQELQPQISLNSLTRINNFQTMKNMAKKLGFSIRPTGPLAVTVADGNNLITTSECKKFQWKFNNTIFTTDVMVLPLGGCEMVLGMQLLATLGDIKCNFKDLRMEFKAQSRMKSHADKGRTDKQFDCGDWVFLKLQLHRQVSLRHPNPDQACGKLPLCDPSGVFIVEPLTILDRRMAKKGNGMEIYVLVQWTNGTTEDAT
ncbi:reverse transcriptase [Tanacetum coccineum]